MSKRTYKDYISSKTPTLVDFYATWCGPCKMMHPILKDLAKEEKGKIKIIKVDIDKNQKLSKKLDIRSVPTFILYQEGKVLWRKSGGLTKTALQKMINSSINK